MKWRKLGKIFDPTEHQLPNNCAEFAKSPQALVFDDFVRIYFSAIEKDATGKFLSHVAFVDFDKTFKKIIRVSDKTVLPLGNLGTFDEHGIFPINILRDKGKILAYTTGWNRKVSVSVDTAIGMAVSDDGGLTFKKVGVGPTLSATLHEPFLIADAFVSIFEGTYHMWYIYGTKWINNSAIGAPPDRVYKIGHATSQDGTTWKKEGKQIITDALNENECQALPTVIHYQDAYHMFFCYREAIDFRKNKQKGYHIGYAHSSNLKHWTRDDRNVGIDVSEEGWDSEMLSYPFVFQSDGNVYMLYNGNEFGRFGFGLAILEQ